MASPHKKSRGKVTAILVPFPGELSMVKLPPSFSARSRIE
jgi:hypothetical protein